MAVAAVTGCLPANYEDVSHEAPYESMIGKKYQTLRDLEVFGVTVDRDSKPPVAYYVITGPPGIGGRYILERKTLVAHSVVEVSRILRCTNCPFDDALRIDVTPRSSDAFGGKPVFIRDVGGLTEIDADKKLALSGEFFEPISN